MSDRTDINQLHINCTNCTMTAGQPNAFGGTFVFFSTHRPTLKKSKRATKQPHQDTANMYGQARPRKNNEGITRCLKKLGVQ